MNIEDGSRVWAVFFIIDKSRFKLYNKMNRNRHTKGESYEPQTLIYQIPAWNIQALC